MTPTLMLTQRIEALRAQGVHSVMCTFTDLHGVPKGKLVPLEALPNAVAVGAGFAAPSIWGTGQPRMGARSEYFGRVVPESLRPLPCLPGVAHAVCDGFAGGQPLDTCSRQVLRRQLARLRECGWTFHVGIEPEFFLLWRGANGRWFVADGEDRLGKPSYDLKAIVRNHGFLGDMRRHLVAMGFELQQMDHEDATGQYEINYRHDEALAAVDGRLEWRLPDASCNVYAALAATLAAGLDGIDRDLPAPEACDADLYQCHAAGEPLPARLPRDLHDVLGALRGRVLNAPKASVRPRAAWLRSGTTGRCGRACAAARATPASHPDQRLRSSSPRPCRRGCVGPPA
jgi:glutamine synthetase